jgi:hypothetical protein
MIFRLSRRLLDRRPWQEARIPSRRHAPGVLAVVCPDNPRDNARVRSYGLSLPSLGTWGGMTMAFVRCYTGTDGQSHFEDLDLLPADIERSIEQAASSITFTR